MSMQTGAPTFGTPEPAIVLYTLAALARRLGVPFRSGGSLYGVEDPRRPGRLRVGGDAAADGARRRQLRAPRRRVARGRPVDRLREVRARRRPARHDGHVRARASTCRRTARRSTPSSRTRPGSTSSARRTRSPTSRPRSTAATPPTTASFEQWTEDGGLDAAQRANKHLEAAPGRRTSRRRSTTRSTRSCTTSSPAARPSCPTRSPDGRFWVRKIDAWRRVS